MRKINKKRKWKIRRKQKIFRHLHRKKRNHYKRNTLFKYRKNKSYKRIVFPPTFSLVNDPSNTEKFFEEILNIVNKSLLHQILFFDLKNITSVSADAIMYLIAILNNSRHIRFYKITCKGNMPDDRNSRKLFIDVGFYQYVKNVGKQIRIAENQSCIKVQNGSMVDTEVARKICDFTSKNVENYNSLSIRRMYSILVEMMSNVKQHAYTENMNKIFMSHWYIYSESTCDRIKYIFLDTGAGIPNTVKKNFKEIVKKKFLQNNTVDAECIKATLKGEFKTETKLEHRGKGIPEIYDTFKSENNKLTNLKIYSGHAICMVNDDGTINNSSNETTFEGTLYSWELIKEA